MQDRIFYTICFGFLVGVFLRSFVFINLYFVIFITSLSVIIILFSYFSKLKWGVISAFFVLAGCLGILRFNMADMGVPAVFESQVGHKVILTGEIVDESSIKETNQQLILKTVFKELSPKTVFWETKILVSTSLDTDYKYGDEINFTGTLKKPENFMTDQGKVFDYINYLRKDGILYTMSYPKIEILSCGHGNWLQSVLFSAKEKFLEKMNFAITGTESLFMGGLILGEKASFSQALRTSFVNTGTIHIVALSGYNVTIVAEWIMKLFSKISFISLNFSIGIGILAIILFIIMTGASSTTIVFQKHIARELELDICCIG